jgi:hypothetical protein
MRKWIWASAALTVAVACGFYGVASWANQHPLSVLTYGTRLASVVGLGHTRVIPACPAPDPLEEGPCAVVQEFPDPSPTHEVDEPIVVENAQPLLPENVEPPELPPLIEEESEPPVRVMPPCPEDELPANGFSSPIILTWSPALPQVPGTGPISDCVIDPNYHHQYPGCPWIGGCQNIPAYVPRLSAERTRTRPAKNKWLIVQALMERLGVFEMEPCEEPNPADDGEPTNLTDIIF